MTAAVMLGRQYQALGGSFVIGSDGKRGRSLPELDQDELPQFAPDNQPHLRFQTVEQWRGAVKFVDALLCQLDDEARTLVYDSLAEAAVDFDRLDPAVKRLGA